MFTFDFRCAGSWGLTLRHSGGVVVVGRTISGKAVSQMFAPGAMRYPLLASISLVDEAERHLDFGCVYKEERVKKPQLEFRYKENSLCTTTPGNSWHEATMR